MKKKLIVCIAVLMAMLLTVTALASGTVTTTGDVYIRKGPGLKYPKITTVYEDTEMDYANEYKFDSRDVKWYKVFYSGSKVGWVSSTYSYLEKGSSASDPGHIKATASTNIRKGPGLDYRIRGTISEGTKLKYLGSYKRDERDVKWYKVSYKGEIGYVSCRYAKLVK